MRKIRAWVRDYAHLLTQGPISYFRLTPPNHYLGYVIEHKAPIVFVPGIFGRWGFYKSLLDHISQEGHPIYVVPRLGNNVASIPVSAKKVRAVIDENKLKNVVLLAHSKGGLIGKYLLMHENSDGRVKGVIAIATPFHGSAAGQFIPHEGIRELAAGSDSIQELERDTASNKKIVSLYPAYDNHVWHEQGSVLDGALANVELGVEGHHLVLTDVEVWATVLSWIEKILSATQH